jgi:class 3 adenylate cyclase/TolB-like protein/tetratricopeptide (TPR) repeat protein
MVEKDRPVEESSEWVMRTLLCMDLVESVRLMESNENDVVRRWRQLVRSVENDILPDHRGRLVKSLGDGLMLEFASVQPAVKTAFAVQQACTRSNSGVPPDQHLLLRMGIHLGKLLVDEHDVYGRGANLASRLLSLAGPGEIIVSADVRDRLTPVLDADIEDLGACYLKHVHDPVRAYRIGRPGPRPVITPAAPMSGLHPTIAVIPFAARSGEPEHQVVGEVLADETITALSRSSELNVISRLSTTIFRGRDASIGEMSAYLHADYVLSGAYRVVGKKLRLTAELAAAKLGTIVWSNGMEGDVLGVLGGEDHLVDELVAEISAAVKAREVERAQSQPLPTLESYTLLIGAIALMHRSVSVQDFDRARQMLEALTERVPRQAVPWAWLATWYVLRDVQRWSHDTQKGGQLAWDCARRALDSDPRCSLALAIAGLVHTWWKRLDVAQEHYEHAVSVNPNDSLAWLLKGTMHAFKGEGKVAVEDTRRALRLSPLDPLRYFYDSLAATAALSAGQYKRAIELAQRSLRANRTHVSTFRALAISQWQSGLRDDARKTVSELLKLDPTFTVKNYLEVHASGAYETGRIWSNALRQAGVPD